MDQVDSELEMAENVSELKDTPAVKDSSLHALNESEVLQTNAVNLTRTAVALAERAMKVRQRRFQRIGQLPRVSERHEEERIMLPPLMPVQTKRTASDRDQEMAAAFL